MAVCPALIPVAWPPLGPSLPGEVVLNGPLFTAQAMESGSLATLDNTYFADTDIPFEVPLPEHQYLSEEAREDIRDWVLAISCDQSTTQELDTDSRGWCVTGKGCPHGGHSLCSRQACSASPHSYVGSLVHHGKTYPECVISGFPVLQHAMEFSHGRQARKEEWNKLHLVCKSTSDEALKVGMLRLACLGGLWAHGVPVSMQRVQDVLRFLNRWCDAPINTTYAFD